MVTIYVPDIPEFSALLRAARQEKTCVIAEPQRGYWRIETEGEIYLERRKLGLGPALWNSALSGGYRGKITQYDRNVLRIVSED